MPHIPGILRRGHTRIPATGAHPHPSAASIDGGTPASERRGHTRIRATGAHPHPSDGGTPASERRGHTRIRATGAHPHPSDGGTPASERRGHTRIRATGAHPHPSDGGTPASERRGHTRIRATGAHPHPSDVDDAYTAESRQRHLQSGAAVHPAAQVHTAPRLPGRCPFSARELNHDPHQGSQQVQQPPNSENRHTEAQGGTVEQHPKRRQEQAPRCHGHNQ
ncbi:skin secretory protein xP2-like [Procambarus clarkii]|uniref:skin secretory protein xP2-like n=1 Tax=Procambarus clarkii TaxID=6728 RepID=UPI0037425EC6